MKAFDKRDHGGIAHEMRTDGEGGEQLANHGTESRFLILRSKRVMFNRAKCISSIVKSNTVQLWTAIELVNRYHRLRTLTTSRQIPATPSNGPLKNT